jgi:hypothetical protein
MTAKRINPKDAMDSDEFEELLSDPEKLTSKIEQQLEANKARKSIRLTKTSNKHCSYKEAKERDLLLSTTPARTDSTSETKTKGNKTTNLLLSRQSLSA